ILYITFLLYLALFESKDNFRPETVFVSVTLFERLRYSLTWTLPQAISGLYDILAACDRMDRFLREPTPSRRTQSVTADGPKSHRKGLYISGMSTDTTLGGDDGKTFGLRDISLTVES